MSKHVDTAFERHFSEPPVVAVKEGRTHCEACKEPLDPTVMHKCHGNQEYQAPVSHTEITEVCPDCGGEGILGKMERWGAGSSPAVTYIVICKACRTCLGPEVDSAANAIHTWNAQVLSGKSANRAKWLAMLPGDDERANIIPSDSIPSDVKASHPDLTSYRGACPATHVEGQVCKLCENTGTIPPTKPEGAQ